MMKNNQLVSNRSHYKGHEQFTVKVKDQMHWSVLHRQGVHTSFLSGVEGLILQQIVDPELNLSLYGGYPEALRKVAWFSPLDETPEYGIVTLASAYDDRFKKIGHRDVLGALMHLGIERDQVGDILVNDHAITVFATETMAEYICTHVPMIGRVPVHFEPTDQIPENTAGYKMIRVNCASLRLDAVVAQLGHCSRKEAMHKIHQGDVKLNEIVLAENDQLCHNDFVSIRRYGKYQFVDVEATTKKDRLILLFKQFL
ncbi:RNA-binding protein YlmH [Catenisphaera adipataccumulans]|uniref:RNA-binding protein YlmH n=2 Tax=Catenisphaera adipataccumulans TaxID=700500 RepID=A0A7W8CX67_9FIRM|nr:RNA-binding protein YlmH [Catenisphaera adipataccumulans]